MAAQTPAFHIPIQSPGYRKAALAPAAPRIGLDEMKRNPYPADAAVCGLSLERAYLADGPFSFEATVPGERVQQVAPMLAAIEQVSALRVPVILLTIDSLGGHFSAGLALYAALEGFRAAGGRVVTYIANEAGSVAAWVGLGDYVVAHKRALISIHGTSAAGGVADEGFTRATDIKRAILGSRTLASAQQIEKWIGKPPAPWRPGWSQSQAIAASGGERLPARRALSLGLVDELGGRQRAMQVAQAFARGEAVRSRRQTLLAARPAVSSHVGPPAAAREDPMRLSKLSSAVAFAVSCGAPVDASPDAPESGSPPPCVQPGESAAEVHDVIYARRMVDGRLLTLPMGKLQRLVTNQALANNGDTQITFDTTAYDYFDIVDDANSEFVAPVGGLYRIEAVLYLQGSAGWTDAMAFLRIGVGTYSFSPHFTASMHLNYLQYIPVSWTGPLAAGDVVSLHSRLQGTGATWSALRDGGGTFMSITQLRDD